MSSATMDPVVPVQDTDAALKQNTLCLSIVKRMPGRSKKASLAGARFVPDGSAPDAAEPDKRLLSLTKCILDSKELDEVGAFDNHTAGLIRKRCFPSMFRAGIFLIAKTEVEEVNTWLKTEVMPQREVLVARAVAAYEQRCVETSARLGVLHNPLDYPSVSEFASAFGFEFQWITWSAPEQLKAISVEIWEQERAKAAGLFASVAEEGRQAQRAIMLKLVSGLRTMLTPNPDGKKKRLHKAHVENLNEFIETFAGRNVTGDTELAGLVETARGVVAGVDPKMLKDENIATKVGQDLDGIIAGLEVLKGTTRLMTFDDTDDEA